MTEHQCNVAIQHEAIQPIIDINPEFESIVPEMFLRTPMVYFETHGVNIKQGDVERDETGRITEDPTAVKDLPIWNGPQGQTIHFIGKRVNVDVPLREYSVIPA